MKKILVFFAAFTVFLSSSLALPGFKAVVPDTSGEYVYYLDRTFERESYIGFLTYDPKTYSARYYAPAEKKRQLPEKEVQIFFTINSDADHIEFTGEKILDIQFLTEEDLKIVNYLHDLIYEFSARRIKLVENNVLSGTQDELEFSGRIASSEDFAQFGGSTQINWNTIIPLFNIESIYNEDDAKNVFTAATFGRITSSDDKSFENFKGFPKTFKAKTHKAKINRKAEILSVKNETTGNSCRVRADWKRLAENMFTLDNFAILVETSVHETNLNFLKRKFLVSSGENYIDFASMEFKDEIFKADYYNFQTGNVTTAFKKFEKSPADSLISYFSLSVFNDVYKKNSRYFNEIIESFSHEKQR